MQLYRGETGESSPGGEHRFGSQLGLRAVHRFPGRDRCRSRKLPVHPVAHIQPLTGSPINLSSCIIIDIQNRRAEHRPKTTIKTKSYQVAHAAPGGHGPPCDCNAQGRWSAASRRGTKSVGHSLLMPRPEVAAHPATAKCKAGCPRRPDAEPSRQVTRCSCRQRRQCARQVVRGVPTRNKAGRTPSDGNAQGRWSAASDTEPSRQVTRCSCRARRSRPTQRRQCARQVVRGVPTRNQVGRSLVAHAVPGGHGPPCDCKVQGRWSAASRRGTKLAGHSLLMPRPEVAAHPATAKCKAGGPRRPDAELAGRSLVAHAATQRRQCARQVVRGVPTRN